MTSPRPFRFGVLVHEPGPRPAWRERARRIEAAGFSTLLLPDHLAAPSAPFPALGVAAEMTDRLRLGTLVVANDFRHPVLLAKDVSTLDGMSDGRFELGIGAGWQRREYEAAGIPFDRAGVRIARLGEALRLLKALFADTPATFEGDFYRVAGLDGAPKPAQHPHPPLLVGGSGERILSLAAREADIVGLIPRPRPEGSGQGSADWTTATETAVRRRIGWVRQAASDRFPALELNAMVYAVMPADDRRAAARGLAGRFGLDEDAVLASPHILVGTVEQMSDDLRHRRAELGISYITIPEYFLNAFAPIAERLAGT